METARKITLPQIIEAYFDAINAQDFQKASALFVESGALVAPLGKCVRGRKEIAYYLQEQCDDMFLYPESIQRVDEDTANIQGHVHCLAFKVAVQWSFYCWVHGIAVVKVQLMADMMQLSYLQSSKYAQ